MPDSIRAALWCYPAAVFSYIVLRQRRNADVCSAVLLSSAATIVGRRAGAAAAMAITMPMGCLIALLAVLLRRHDDVQRKLAEETITDPLTGAFNRRHLEACLTTAIDRRNRTSEGAALLMIDVDHFKAINDSLGHAAGDDVLKGLVGLIGGRIRSIDVLFRTGGEEFALLLTGARYRDALVVAEDLRRLVGDSTLLDSGRVSISVGVSELQRNQSAYAWSADADQALYRAKRDGRDRVGGRALASAS
jgi:diguanylate cyclase (GGDEF)-like protein